MHLEEAIKGSYENLGLAVLDVHHVPETVLFEIEFIGPNGIERKKIITFFAMLHEPNQCNGQASL